MNGAILSVDGPVTRAIGPHGILVAVDAFKTEKGRVTVPLVPVPLAMVEFGWNPEVSAGTGNNKKQKYENL